MDKESNFRLEYSEEQGSFHMAPIESNYEGTNGYLTIIENCNIDQMNIVEAYLFRNETNGIDGYKEVKYRITDVLLAVEELKGFQKTLKERNYSIVSRK